MSEKIGGKLVKSKYPPVCDRFLIYLYNKTLYNQLSVLNLRLIYI